MHQVMDVHNVECLLQLQLQPHQCPIQPPAQTIVGTAVQSQQHTNKSTQNMTVRVFRASLEHEAWTSSCMHHMNGLKYSLGEHERWLTSLGSASWALPMMIASALMMPALRRTWPSIESPSICLNLQLGISPSPVGQSCRQCQNVDSCTAAEAALT